MQPRITDRLSSLLGGIRQWQLAMFLLVGVLNMAFGYGCYILLLWLGLHLRLLAALLSTGLGVLFNFLTSGRIVFRNRDNRRFVHFVAMYAAIYGLDLLGLRLLIAAGAGAYWGGAILVLPLALISYVLQKRFVFTEETRAVEKEA